MVDTEPDICGFNGALKRNLKTKKPRTSGSKALVPASSLGETRLGGASRVNPLNSTTKHHGGSNSYSLAKLAIVLVAYLPTMVRALPLPTAYHHSSAVHTQETLREDPESPDFWFNMLISFVLVVLGGAFAGLTLGLMGQDEINLQVIRQSGEPHEQYQADKVLRVLNKGKHWVLVTLLLSNVITNETLPIVLDRCLGGGWPAVVSSTVAIVIFGEIIPQSICVRHGLAVGSTCAPFVLALMYLMYPVAYPVALLLDRVLGEDHGTVYKKSGLKTFVTLHQTSGLEPLNEDEVTIISAVLDLKEKSVRHIMTPIDDVFILSADTVLDEPTTEKILHTGFNRIPIHVPGEPFNFIGMLLVRILITYDPEDALPISSFPLATLPETGPDTSCLNILNYFQEGKSHMIIVSENPGESHGAIGVLTLEDVIEELIGEEIIDETDVYVDVHKAIRRTQPGPLAKRQMIFENALSALAGDNLAAAKANSNNADGGGSVPPNVKPILGPSNKASNPIHPSTRNIHVKPASKLPSDRTQVNVPPSSSTGLLIETGTKDGEHHGAAASNANGAIHDAPKIGNHDRRPFVSQDDMSLTVPIMDSPSGGHSVAYTEAGAIKESLVNSSLTKHLVASASDLFGDLTAEERQMSPALSEGHSYRTGGIIESVVEVDGVSRIVIEEESSDEQRRQTSPHSRQSRHSPHSPLSENMALTDDDGNAIQTASSTNATSSCGDSNESQQENEAPPVVKTKPLKKKSKKNKRR